MDSPGKRLKNLVGGGEVLLMPGVFDGFSVRMAEAAGFKAAIVSGAGLSESTLGLPDVGLMGLEENLRATRALAARVSIPLLADIDTGYGNAVNVHHAVKLFEQAGVGGVMIEDQVWPKRCGHMDGKEVIAADEMVEKIHAATEARSDPDFVIKARTDALAPEGMDETVRRLNLYADAGADWLIADAVASLDDIKHVAENTAKPLVVNMGIGVRERRTTPLIAPGTLAEAGVAVVAYSRLFSASAVRGMFDAVAALHDANAANRTEDRPDLAVSFEELMDLIGLDEAREVERRFSTAAQLEAKYGKRGG